MLEAQGGFDPARLLLIWTLFEGVPKFYRDLYEQDVLAEPRARLLETMFFRSSSPLRYEAENWFLKELHGRYDSVLKFLATHPGATHGEIVGHVRETSRESDEQIGGHLHVLADRYRMIAKRLPVFAKPKARRSRYYISDNFLLAWLSCLGPEVAAVNFRPVGALVAAADARLAIAEGRAFEKLVAQLHEERSRKALGDFPLSRKLDGYRDSSDTEVDLVALDEPGRRIRLGLWKRDAERLWTDRAALRAHGDRFLEAHPQFKDWTVERAAFAPALGPELRAPLVEAGFVALDLSDLLEGL
jgi:hypothetical protein